MKLGISTYSFPWAFGVPHYPVRKPMTATELLNKAAENDIHVVQIGDNFPLHMSTSQDRQEIIVQAKKKNIKLEVGTRRLTIHNLRLYLEIAAQMNSGFLRIVIDDADFHPNETEVIKTLNEILPELKGKKIMLAIENHDRFPSVSLQRIIENTDPEWIGICLDTANSLGAGEGINEVVEILAPYTINLHVKDFKIHRLDHKMGFEVKGCPAGKGMLNIPTLIEKLKQTKKCQTATLEVWSHPQENMEATLKNEADWVKESLFYLKEVMGNG